MVSEVEQFREELLDDIRYKAVGSGYWSEDAFFEIVTNIAMEEGDIPTADRVPFDVPRRGKIDGYGGDPIDDNGILSLMVIDYDPFDGNGVVTLTATEMDAVFRRVRMFVQRSLNPTNRNEMEESSPAFGLADLISQRWKLISRVRIVLLTNKVLSNRIDRRDEEDLESKPCSYSVWDLTRLKDISLMGQAREEMYIDMVKDFGGALPALPAHPSDSSYEAYMTVFRGDNLAKIYDKWGKRLLESNVRVFLQGRNKVNKSIINTLTNQPEMFFAYNNGITATAEAVQVDNNNGSLEITGFTNLQIVNGAQTTGSIFSVLREKEVDLSKAFVQMKLSVIKPEKSAEIVPKISEYANTQTRVNSSDFFASHPFHIRIERLSRRIAPPKNDGFGIPSKWFYERVRGQWQDSRINAETLAKRKNFETEFPKKKFFDKTFLAKYLNAWNDMPDTLSKGKEYNFAEFAKKISKEWGNNEEQFNDMYYHHLIAKKIIFEETEKIVSNSKWYGGGYRANIVYYSISKLSYDLKKENKFLDFGIVWDTQELPKGLYNSLILATTEINNVLINPPISGMNVTEWSKKEACWSRVSAMHIDWPIELNNCLITEEQSKNNKRASRKVQIMDNSFQAQITVLNAGVDFWNEVALWGIDRKLITPSELNMLRIISMNQILSDKQSSIILAMFERLQKEGCALELPS